MNNNNEYIILIVSYLQYNNFDITSFKLNEKKTHIKFSTKDDIDISFHQHNLENIFRKCPQVDWIDFAFCNLQIGFKQ